MVSGEAVAEEGEPQPCKIVKRTVIFSVWGCGWWEGEGEGEGEASQCHGYGNDHLKRAAPKEDEKARGYESIISPFMRFTVIRSNLTHLPHSITAMRMQTPQCHTGI